MFYGNKVKKRASSSSKPLKLTAKALQKQKLTQNIFMVNHLCLVNIPLVLPRLFVFCEERLKQKKKIDLSREITTFTKSNVIRYSHLHSNNLISFVTSLLNLTIPTTTNSVDHLKTMCYSFFVQTCNTRTRTTAAIA